MRGFNKLSGHEPIRKCIACGSRRNEIELLRIVKNKDQILIDPGSDLPGRGAYLCPSENCINKSQENNLLEKALKTEISDNFYHKIMEEIGND